MNDRLYICSACHIDVCEHTKEHIVKLEKELDKYQDKTYHSTRLIEQLEHEIELLREVVKVQREGLEMYAATAHWIGVYHNDCGELSALLNENDYDFIKVDENDQYYAGGKCARQTLAKVDEMIKVING